MNFWINFLFLVASWILASFYHGLSVYVLLFSILFFSCYFLMPLFKKKVEQIGVIVLPIIAFSLFYSGEWNPFIWFIYILLAMHAKDLFHTDRLVLYIGFLYILSSLPLIRHEEYLVFIYMTLLLGITFTLFMYWLSTVKEKERVGNQYETINQEYRLMKRQVSRKEETARQEERNQVAREIHDSVGHRLTALLMQLEVARLQETDEKTKQKWIDLKQLAQESLNETRQAVRALKEEEAAGLQAVIQLIRKLEAESHLRVVITMHPGVVGIVLSNKQSVTVYRAIQESLTNMMRHSLTRKAEIEFQIVADRDFRFQVSHKLDRKIQIKEGFGLTNMRERLGELGGQLTVSQIDGRFRIIGQFPLEGIE